MDDSYEVTTFTALEIDLDYEFDAVRFFDFCRQETVLEANLADRWFHSAATYPPSPFAAKLAPRLDLLLDSHVNISSTSKDGDDMNLCGSNTDGGEEEGVSAMDAIIRDNDDRDKKPCLNIPDRNMETFYNQMQKIRTGLSSCNEMIKDNFKPKTDPSLKPSYPRSSTLMRPTASQLAKQNKAQPMGNPRFVKSLKDNNQKNYGNQRVMETQAPKRQKLEGGHLCKVGDTTQQSNFTHKEPKKDGAGMVKHFQTKMRITVPREPDLETAHRAQRLRPKACKDSNDMTTTVSTFKARPLNRKILECPSLLLPKRSNPKLPEFQEFHFKTSERAMQHSSATLSTILPRNSTKAHKFSSTFDTEWGNREPRRPNHVDNPRQGTCESSHPLHKKIFASKGNIGVLQNAKRETTVSMGFNFQIAKQVDHDLPINMFNKLSLGSDPQANTGSQLKPPGPNFLLLKGSKENKCDNFSKEQEVKKKSGERKASLRWW